VETADLERNLESTQGARREAEKIVIAIASRYGLQAHDFSIAWDGGSFQPSRAEHELTITRRDGSRAAARIGEEVLLRKDAWKYFRDLENAFAQLNRRVLPRDE
jgi:hypothetical protein